MKKGLWYGSAAFCLLLFAARFFDLALYLDPNTGFTTAGSVWVRIAGFFLGAAALCVFAVFLPKGELRTARGKTLFAGTGLLTGAVLLGFGLYAFPAQLLCFHYANAFLGLWCAGAGAFLAVGSGRLLYGKESARPLSALLGVLSFGYFYALLIARFVAHPSSIYRLSPTLQILSAVCLMLFSTALLRVFCLREGALEKRRAFLLGMLAFLFCFCMPAAEGLYKALLLKESFLFRPELLCEAAMGLLGLVLAKNAAFSEKS